MENTPPRAVDLLVEGCDVVAFDGADTTLRDAAIAIEGGAIAWIGPAAEARSRFAPRERLDGRDRIAMPGLVDAHMHTGQQLLRGKIFELSRRTGIRNPVWKNYYIPFEGMLDEEEVRLSALLCYADLLSNGTTCFAEAGGPRPDIMGEAALDAGIRGVIALSTVDMGNGIPPSMMLSTDEALRRNVELVERWKQKGQGLVTAALSLRQIMVCTTDLIRMMAEEARRLGAMLHTHLCEGSYEIDFALERFGKRPAEYLDSLGCIGPFLHAAHAIMLSQHEMDLLVGNDVSIAHCAFNNYAIGHPRVLEMLHKGVRLGLGTDGAAALGTMDMFQVARCGRIAQQCITGTSWHERFAVSGEMMLRATCAGGGRALGLDIGTLEVGRRADIILLRADDPDHQPVYDPMFSAANTAVGRDVRTAIVDGRVVMKEREFTALDTERMAALLRERHPGLMHRFETEVA
ncbi:amidohydrolase family protein [Roseomonas populi]|uniref:Amidohydrolase family protein n=1 Tax=Roseomonas populi TaxID=3121582 RepID=A0ABT1X2A2_9PROT|nr:amidohydrolase family protein [Roseomonas pecuniae]MCR0982228.1 amidohydrolase family protein [Roseomonas pecuniae]